MSDPHDPSAADESRILDAASRPIFWPFKRKPRGSDTDPEPRLTSSTDELSDGSGIDKNDQSLLAELKLTHVVSASEVARAVRAIPVVGMHYLGFHLVSELGSGGFGRVYLAEQEELANRFVALKITTDETVEARSLAKLQHTNIVPVYSVHIAEPFRAVCMPYFGSTTFSDLIAARRRHPGMPATVGELLKAIPRREGPLPSSIRRPAWASSSSRSHSSGTGEKTAQPPRNEFQQEAPLVEVLNQLGFVDGVLFLFKALADGLAHAHERGILHRDLKPANVLLTDDGQPMLLDFNLSRDVRQTPADSPVRVGGTLPYMSPEQLEGWREHIAAGDERSDIYSLGVLLFELLTGVHPFESQPSASRPLLEHMIAARRAGAPDARREHKALSLAVASIIRHCLEPEPDHRYQSARHLHEDLQRYLDAQSLRHAPDPSLFESARRAIRRHPIAVTAAALMLLASTAIVIQNNRLTVRQQQLARLDALKEHDQLVEFSDTAYLKLQLAVCERESLDDGIRDVKAALERHRSVVRTGAARPNPHLTSKQVAALQQNALELCVLLAQAYLLKADSVAHVERQPWLNLARDANLRAEELLSGAGAPPALAAQREAIDVRSPQGSDLPRVSSIDPAHPAEAMLRAMIFLAQRQFGKALPYLRQADERNPNQPRIMLSRSIYHLAKGEVPPTIQCLSSYLTIRPDSTLLYFLRAKAYRLTKRDNYNKEAVADLDEAIRRAPSRYDFYLERSLARKELGDFAGALADVNAAIDLGAPTVSAYMARSSIHAGAGQELEAKLDVSAASQSIPTTANCWLALGLARRNSNPRAAIAHIDKSLAINQFASKALHAKAYLLGEKLRDFDGARQTLDRILEIYPDDMHALRLRALVNARAGNRQAALADATASLDEDKSAKAYYHLAGVYAQTSRVHAADSAVAFRHLEHGLAGGYGKSLIERDRDLDPIRGNPKFAELVTVAKAGGSFPPPRDSL